MSASKPARTRTRGLLVAAGLALLTRAFVLEPVRVEGASMWPTLEDGERVWVLRAAYGFARPFGDGLLLAWREPARGDVVVLRRPDEPAVVKRVFAVAGDEVEVRRTGIWLNGTRSRDTLLRPCHRHDGSPDACRVFETRSGAASHEISRIVGTASPVERTRVRIAEGHVFVLGDGRNTSVDSRHYGPVPIARITGRVLGD